MTIRHTLRPGHAVELGKLQQPGDDCFHGIICCGGDGHIAQVQQSNLRFRKVPIAIVPAGLFVPNILGRTLNQIGTDNALAATLCIRSWFHAVLTIIKGHIEPIDTVSVHEVDLVTRHGASPSENYLRVGKCLTYAHSCVGWAFVGDVLEGFIFD